MRYVLTDIDNTLSDATWRYPWLGRWDEYHSMSDKDQPINFTSFILRAVRSQAKIIAITARPEVCRKKTMEWFKKYDIPVTSILMRKDIDHRPSSMVKADLIIENFPDLSVIDFILDDRDDVCSSYVALGLNVLQVRRKM